MRAGHAGYADKFEMPKVYPGRVADAASWDLARREGDSGQTVAGRIATVDFHFRHGGRLINIRPLRLPAGGNHRECRFADAGRRHLWLWLTKRPGRMAEFGEWLQSQGISWPHNLVPMTTVTMQRYAQRADQLRRVPGKLRGLSVEPLFEPVDLDLRGIDWVIAGGGSDVLAEPFHVEWAMNLREQCRAAGVAFFLNNSARSHSIRTGRWIWRQTWR